MGILISDGTGGGKHRCQNERPQNGMLFSDGTTHVRTQPAGMVWRCSCGMLWHTKFDFGSNSYTRWVKSGFFMKKKYKDVGWEGLRLNDGY